MDDDRPADQPLPDAKPDDKLHFDQENLVKSVIAMPLLRAIEKDPAELHWVIIDVNLRHREGRLGAKTTIYKLVEAALQEAGSTDPDQKVNRSKSDASHEYVYARLQGNIIRSIVERDQRSATRAIFHIWPDFIVSAQIWKSVATVKADACRRAFATSGKGIVWAVLDSGIDGKHPHFDKHANLRDLPGPVTHLDFTADPPAALSVPVDDYGHGTHVAGIIAGELEATSPTPPIAIVRERDETGKITYLPDKAVGNVAGIAPECKLVSFKVLDRNGQGPISNVIAAIDKIQEINGFGREIVIHGVNLSVGYDFDAEWFACGQSPVCVEVNRLVKAGVCVVIAAGNTGRGFALTINDPGNAEEAITVGATHRDMPHTYGVSYFSSKGPTGDGRRKPDLLAPGERIVSCGAGPDLNTFKTKAGLDGDGGAYYIERSGTSQATPHVSGVIAGLLSVRGEFVGRPQEIKRLLMENAMDLGRDDAAQGRGLVDMLRAIQAI